MDEKPPQTSSDDDVLRQALEKELINRKREEEDGTESSTLTFDRQARMGVLLKLLTAVEDEKLYRQAILTSDLIDDEEADRVAAAFSEATRYGLSVIPIMDWLAARAAVNKFSHGKGRPNLTIEGLTHSTFSYLGGGKKGRFEEKGKEEGK